MPGNEFRANSKLCITMHSLFTQFHASSAQTIPGALMLGNRIEFPVLRDINYKNADSSGSAGDNVQ